jgi:hypothetical protein
VSVIGVETGKVIDVEVKSYCKTCRERKGSKKGAVYDAWLEEHTKYTASHQGSVVSMECSGMITIFNHSEVKYGVKYVEYIGGGDTKSFKSI